MLTIRAMMLQDRELVMPMVQEFYDSPAVDHAVDPAILDRSFAAAVDPAEPLLWGLVLEEDEVPAGYCYMTQGYTAEAGGRMILIEELYFRPQCRGKGYGTQVFRHIMDTNPGYVRFRLEVTDANQGAVRLYKKLGFDYLEYKQMVLDR